MEIALFLLVGFGLGLYVGDRRASMAESRYEQQLTAITLQNATLNRDIATLNGSLNALRACEHERQIDANQRRQYFEANDISDARNQLRFIGQCDLQPRRPVNREAVQVLYALDEWIKTNQPGWRFGFEVSMGAFIRTTANNPKDQKLKDAFSSYNSKRVDFLLIDRYGKPRLVIEYHGSGHELSGDASERMQVKRLALARAKIPLLEVPERTPKADIVRAISTILSWSDTSWAPSQVV